MNRTERRRAQRRVKQIKGDQNNYNRQITSVLSLLEREIKHRTKNLQDSNGNPVPGAWDLMKVNSFVGYLCNRLNLREDAHEMIRQAVIRNMIGGKVALGHKGHLKHQ